MTTLLHYRTFQKESKMRHFSLFCLCFAYVVMPTFGDTKEGDSYDKKLPPFMLPSKASGFGVLAIKIEESEPPSSKVATITIRDVNDDKTFRASVRGQVWRGFAWFRIKEGKIPLEFFVRW